MQLETRDFSPEFRPFALAFLNAILAKYPLSGRNRRPNGSSIEGLGNSDKLDRPRRPAGLALRFRHMCAHFFQPLLKFHSRTSTYVADFPPIAVASRKAIAKRRWAEYFAAGPDRAIAVAAKLDAWLVS
jgi:hypothetical protein